MSRIYITRWDTSDAEATRYGSPPEAIYRVTIDGTVLTATSSGSQWFMTFTAAATAARRVVTTTLAQRVEWRPQYDSAYAEAADEPCGYVGRVVDPGSGD